MPTQIWSDFMAKAHEGLPPSNLPDASAAAVPATELETTSGDGITDLVNADGQLSDRSTSPALPRRCSSPPAKRSPKTIGDMLTNLFGGG